MGCVTIGAGRMGVRTMGCGVTAPGLRVKETGAPSPYPVISRHDLSTTRRLAGIGTRVGVRG